MPSLLSERRHSLIRKIAALEKLAISTRKVCIKIHAANGNGAGEDVSIPHAQHAGHARTPGEPRDIDSFRINAETLPDIVAGIDRQAEANKGGGFVARVVSYDPRQFRPRKLR